jgi:hypothetical protein
MDSAAETRFLLGGELPFMVLAPGGTSGSMPGGERGGEGSGSAATCTGGKSEVTSVESDVVAVVTRMGVGGGLADLGTCGATGDLMF